MVKSSLLVKAFAIVLGAVFVWQVTTLLVNVRNLMDNYPDLTPMTIECPAYAPYLNDTTPTRAENNPDPCPVCPTPEDYTWPTFEYNCPTVDPAEVSPVAEETSQGPITDAPTMSPVAVSCPASSPCPVVTCPTPPPLPEVECRNLQPTRSTRSKLVDGFLEYPYFPFVSNDTMTFKEAIDYCASYEGYTLAGFDALNKNFLEDTKELLLIKNNVRDHWMAGYFNVTRESPYLIHWLQGGKRSDGKRNIPYLRYCDDQIISQLANLRDKLAILKAKQWTEILSAAQIDSFEALNSVKSYLEENTCDIIVPITRNTKGGCLSIDTSSIFRSQPKRSHALCMRKEPTPYVKTANNDIVPTYFIRHAFNKTSLNFPYTRTKLVALAEIMRQDKDAVDEINKDFYKFLWPIRVFAHDYYPTTVYKPHLMVGWAQSVSYNYAENFCSYVKYADETTNGYLLGKKHLQYTEDDLAIDIRKYRRMHQALTFSLSFLVHKDRNEFHNSRPMSLRVNGIISNLLLATGGGFYFNHPDYKYNELVWKGGKEEIESIENISFQLPWCESGYDLQQDLDRIYEKFNRWHAAADQGKFTTGPYMVPIAISANPLPCLKLVPDNLYWPTSTSFVPVCEKSFYAE